MERQFVFAGLLLLGVLYALLRGGAPERWAAAFYILAYGASIAAKYHDVIRHSTFDWSVFLVDAVLAMGLVGLSLKANRYWTLWVASFQIVALTAHLVKMLVPEVVYPAYEITLLIWSYAAIPVLVIAARRHRIRIRHFGNDVSWSPA